MAPLLLLLIFLQDVDAIVERLRSDDAKTREAATAELIALGTPALTELRKFQGDPDVEVQTRIRVAITEIERRERVRAVWPVRSGLTLELRDEPIEEAMVKAFKPFGVRASLYRKSDRTISFRLEDATLWKAFDAFTSAGGVRLFDGHAHATDWFFVEAKSFRPRYRVFDRDDLRIVAQAGSSILSKPSTKDVGFSLSVLLLPGTRLRDCSVENLVITAERKRPLKMVPDREVVRMWWDPFRKPGAVTRWPLASGKITRSQFGGAQSFQVGGKLVLTVPHDLRTVAFDLGETKDSGKTLNGMRVTFKRSTASVRWEVIDRTADRRSDGRTYWVWTLDEKGRWMYDVGSIQVVGAGSKALGKFRDSPSRLVVGEVIGGDRVEIPFVIKDIPVPK